MGRCFCLPSRNDRSPCWRIPGTAVPRWPGVPCWRDLEQDSAASSQLLWYDVGPEDSIRDYFNLIFISLIHIHHTFVIAVLDNIVQVQTADIHFFSIIVYV